MVTNNLMDKYTDEYEFSAYIHNYYYRRHYIYEVSDKLSKTIFKEWKRMNININNNKYYQNLLKDDV